MIKKSSFNTQNLVLLALLTAIVVVLQLLSVVFPVYPFRLALVLVPIVVGAALIGPLAGLWLGGVFGFVVLISSPDVAFFMAFNPLATILVILSRGLLAGLSAGLIYRLFYKKGKTYAVIGAAFVTPIVNTGLFIIGLQVFFEPIIGNAIDFFIAFVLINFLIELGVNLILSPTIVRLIQVGKKEKIS
jgi:uncharacterized membrane protein